MDRRTFMTSTAACGAALGLGAAWPASVRRLAHHPLGLQLFTVMVELEADFEGTLKTIAQIGYREVETIGAFGRDPKWVRASLDAAGLVSPSQHLVPFDLYSVFLKFTRREISEEKIHEIWVKEMSLEKVGPIIEQGIERAKIMGQKYLVWQILWPEQMNTRAATDAFCRMLDTAGSLCADAGLTFNFHNHAAEFKVYDGIVPYQRILDTTNPKTVKLELDVYWATHGGANPVELLTKYPERYVQLHLKDSTANGGFATVGKGVIDFPAVLAAARKASVRHYYVEYDRAAHPMKVVRDAYAYLHPLV